MVFVLVGWKPKDTNTLYKCTECGWSIYDESFFTEVDEEFYCSLHKERKAND
jgi:hypothetical protein